MTEIQTKQTQKASQKALDSIMNDFNAELQKVINKTSTLSLFFGKQL
jgi:hypothetical protein